jgi:hypothetical protein
MYEITINVPVDYMVREVMIQMSTNPFREQLEEMGLENRDFQGPPLPMVRVMNLPSSKSLSPCAIKNRYIGNFIYISLCILFSVLYVVGEEEVW